jgi:hypothetical protein
MSTQLLRHYIDILNETAVVAERTISPDQVWAMADLNEMRSDDTSVWEEPLGSGGMVRDQVDRLVNDIDRNISTRSKNVDISIESGELSDTLIIVIDAKYIIPLFADNIEPDMIHKAMLIVLNLYRMNGWNAEFKDRALVLTATRKH